MKIGILREEKIPPDSRVPLTPDQVSYLNDIGLDVVVQKSNNRCFTNAEYDEAGVELVDSVDDCDVLIGVKEVPPENLIPGKKYFMFSHTIKEQPYNQKLIRSAVQRKITLIDYELLTNKKGARVIAFGKFAGMVGAHNALYTYGQRSDSYSLPRMRDLKEYQDAKSIYKSTNFPALKIVLTGTGRVSQGSSLVLDDMGFKRVSYSDYLLKDFDYGVYTQLSSFHYAVRKDGKINEQVQDFFQNPYEYQSNFEPYANRSDVFINGIYWDPDAPAFFTVDDLKRDEFNIQVIADITCDIAPESSVPTTLRPTTIEEPIFGYDIDTGKETDPFGKNTIDVMAIDNLPNELPREASKAFGTMFINHIIPELNKDQSEILQNASILIQGKLGANFQYMKEYAGV